jgi:hypothetical protein
MNEETLSLLRMEWRGSQCNQSIGHGDDVCGWSSVGEEKRIINNVHLYTKGRQRKRNRLGAAQMTSRYPFPPFALR